MTRVTSRTTAVMATALAAAALASATTAQATPSPQAPAAHAAVITNGQQYVLAPQSAPDRWLGEESWDHIVSKASRLWYGSSHDQAVWTARAAGDGSFEFQNHEFGGSIQDDNGAVEANWGHGGTWDWTAIPGAGGTFALKNKITGRYLALNAAGVAVAATNAYFWYVVNTHP